MTAYRFSDVNMIEITTLPELFYTWSLRENNTLSKQTVIILQFDHWLNDISHQIYHFPVLSFKLFTANPKRNCIELFQRLVWSLICVIWLQEF